ncbi:right-handed parallel beta-helix repeat-containing protein [Neorhodopirellula pilleata]|uniref:right-handed parallel beta-helix repeat-containing protein n=1 Tax=Neorhodopirellula pilleata TaxID=2714738 RepID=UPI0028F45362|nr:right-handed parallel beta-helix repeat-containing protein [Neorhodopirellula pilleata]
MHVADGTYYLPSTLVFSSADSGTEAAPIVYRAENEGGAVLSGGSRLQLTWKPYRDGIYSASTPEDIEIDQLFVEGRNQRMARYPNYDATKPTAAYQGFSADAFSKQRAANWSDPTGGYIHAMHLAGWGGYHYRITGKDAGGVVTYEGGWQNNRRMGMHKDHRMVENIFEELDAPGEWFHDAKTSMLYYKPEPATDLSKVNVEVVRLRHLVEFQGSGKSPVRFIALQGFTVRHAARTFMDCKEQLLRSDWAIYRGGAFMLTGTEDVSILDCEFDQVGGNAVFVNNYNRRVLVKGCHIHDTGASGVCFVGDPDAVRNPLFEYGQKNNLATIDRTPGPKTNNYPAQSAVEDCLIHGIGRVERQPAGVQIEMASEITVRDCSVYDTARAGINIGDGAWGGHLIERCDVFDTVLETHDHGSFNSWGRDRYWRSDHLTASQKAVDAEPNLPFLDAMKTTVIRDSRWRCDHGWDIDLDDGSSNYDIYNNLLLNTGLKLREGFRRHAWNNVMPVGALHPHVWFQRSKDQVHTNIMSARHRTARMNEPYTDGTMVDRNLYDSQDVGILEYAAKLGWDANSVLREPMYVDPANGDFRVKEGSPALKLGFKNFPMDLFGVKKPSLKAIAKTPEIPSLDQSARQSPGRSGARAGATPLKMVWLGATLKDLKGEEFSAYGVSKETGGIALADVPIATAADNAGLKKGDLIQAINGKSVANIERLFQALLSLETRRVSERHTLKAIRNQQPIELTAKPESTVVIETATNPNNFSKLPVPAATQQKIVANQNTNNDPLSTLTDGKLDRGFGPVFSNTIFNGAYKLDLGGVKPVMAVTSWSFNQGNTRAAQKLTIYASDSEKDPGWNLDNFTPLGTIYTGENESPFLAASLRGVNNNTLGNFRWIVWSVTPVSELGGGENTAFQELAVDTAGAVRRPSKADENASQSGPTALKGHRTKDSRPEFPGVKTNFRGYDRYDRIKTSAGHFSVVCPKESAPGKPWLWRSMFWEAIKKVSDADLKLVDEGYHIVLAHGDVAGHPSGNASIDAAYQLLTTEYGFSKKCANMSSMSRGTLSLFRWASANPEKVDSIYVDNGVCNVLSWPAGKLVPGSGSKASGAPDSWEDFKRKFGYATDEEAVKTKESPIDQLEPLAKAGVPILMVCGNKDTAVPYEENDAIMEQRYKALGGSITVIVEDKGHSHGMNDPTPVLNFIRKHTSASKKQTTAAFNGQTWIIDSQEDWQAATADQSNLDFKDGLATPTATEATFCSVLITSDKKRSAKSLTIAQSPVWHNWEPIPNLGPSNLGDAPVMLTVGRGNYWIFGRYGGSEKKKGFKSEASELEGFDVPLTTTPFPNQYDAPGGLKKGLGGYHAWQSRDMINWVHHGPVSEAFSSWVTTAEYVDGKLFLYYDYPNDQDPHLYIDDDLTDGLPGKNMGMAFNDPSHGSDCAFIRDLNGNFHVIYEDWSPIDASTHSWDSPLAGHAVSSDGIGNFKILPPAVDFRTRPTGKFAEYPHPHWHATDPKKYPGKSAPVDVPQHRIKKGDVRAFAKYEVHEPEQNAFGDWASICIGGQYYLFADYHPANRGIRVGWFTSSSLDKPFTFCGEIGKGHPDPDVMFAEGRFYLATQMSTDYVSPGPWVETVKARVGVDTDKDSKIDHWTDWTELKESYDYIKSFSKQIAKTPAELNLSMLPAGYGFQLEVRLTDSTENESKPIIERMSLSFAQ